MASDRHIFINAPFDSSRQNLFRAMVFAVIVFGRTPRCALEIAYSAKSRIEKIVELIRSCGRGIHDLSYMQLDPATKLPRFNMPFELGLFMGAMHYGNKALNEECFLLLDSEKHRVQKCLSDLAGHDIAVHEKTEQGVINAIGEWLHIDDCSRRTDACSSFCALKREFASIEKHLRSEGRAKGLDGTKIHFTYLDYVRIVRWWRDRYRSPSAVSPQGQ